ncbi:Anti-sigma-I factor RsgI [compost metagenome]
MILFTGLTSVFSDKSVVAYVSIDINPSIELGIDKNKRVREMKGLNDKGLEIVRSVSYKGRSMDDVTDKILQKAEEMKLFATGEADIVIASTVVKEDAALDDTQVTEALKQQVLAHVVTKHPEEADKIKVTAFAAPAEIVDTAKENGLSLGKYSVYLNAKNAGHDIKVEDLQKDSIHNIASVEGGIASLLDTKSLEKESIRELLKEEKDGTLDKKIQEKKATPTPSPTKTPQKSTSPTNKATVTPSKNATPTPTATPKSSVKPSTSPTNVRNGSAPSKSPASGSDKKDDDKKDTSQNGKKDDDKNNDKKDDGPNNGGKQQDDKNDKNDKNGNNKNDNNGNNNNKNTGAGKNNDNNNNGRSNDQKDDKKDDKDNGGRKD